jgi:hypothetical protein
MNAMMNVAQFQYDIQTAQAAAQVDGRERLAAMAHLALSEQSKSA